MTEPKITRRKLKDYQQAPANPNKHNPRGLQAIEDSVNYNGAGRSGLATKDGVLLAGNGTWEAMARAGIEDVIEVETDGQAWVVVKRNDLSKDDPRAISLMIGDNKIQQVDFTPDDELILRLLNQIGAEDAKLVQAAGFDDADVNALLDSLTPPTKDDPGAQVDRAGELQAKWLVERGDVWQIGKHRLMCGDSTSAEDVVRLLGNDKPQLMVTDPPYGVDYEADWRNDAFGEANRAVGQVTNDDRTDWFEAWQHAPVDVVYCWHADRRASSVEASLIRAGFETRAQIIWSKSHFVVGRGHYHTRHEPCWYMVRKGVNSHWIGADNEQTIWEFGLDERANGGHSTQKPLECMARPIRNHDAPIVYDPFGGSGTTMVACENLNRQCRMMELEAKYCSVILERLSQMGLEPQRITNATP